MAIARLIPHPKSSSKNSSQSVFFRFVLLSLTLFAVTLSAPALSKPVVHTVYEGQRLASIAKRYNVTVEALCAENGISAKAPIKPGQKLIIPGTDDGKPDKKSDVRSNQSGSKGSPTAKDAAKPSGKATVHIVQKGHTLSAISGRYAVTIAAICHANQLDRNAALSVGQRLVIPHKTDTDGSSARQQKLRGDFDEAKTKSDAKSPPPSSAANKKSWEPYVKPAWRRGYIKLSGYNRTWEGYVIGPKGEVLGHASNKINYVLNARSDGPRIDPKLIRLIASVSDTFGGREIRVVSGFRSKSFVADSKHKQGKALDFSIPGIPNEVLRDYLRSLDEVGVGYYPNSSFVHLDVRGYNSYWIDYARPGEAPRKSPGRTPKKKTDADVNIEVDEASEDDSEDAGHDHGTMPEAHAVETTE